ncbi:hypothetical protein ES702_01760 [subsurface metagenome]
MAKLLSKGMQGFVINALITIGIIMLTRRITFLKNIVYGE